MSTYGPNDMDNPSEDQELFIGQTVYSASRDDDDITRVGFTPQTVVKVGSSHTDYDYIVRSPSGAEQRVRVEDVYEIEGKMCLINAEVLRGDATELSLPEKYEDFELLGTEKVRESRFVRINFEGQDKNIKFTKAVPVELWGHYMIKSYTDLNIISTRTTVLPMVCLDGQLEPQRVTPEMFAGWCDI